MGPMAPTIWVGAPSRGCPWHGAGGSGWRQGPSAGWRGGWWHRRQLSEGKHQFLSPGRNKAPGCAGKQPGTNGPGVLVDPELIEPAPCPCCKKADDLQGVPSQKPQLSACGSTHPAFLGALCQQRLLSALSSARWCCGPAVLAQGCFGELCLRVSSWWCVLFFFPWSRDIQSLERTAESRSACRCLLSPPKDRLKLVFSPD